MTILNSGPIVWGALDENSRDQLVAEAFDVDNPFESVQETDVDFSEFTVSRCVRRFSMNLQECIKLAREQKLDVEMHLSHWLDSREPVAQVRVRKHPMHFKHCSVYHQSEAQAFCIALLLFAGCNIVDANFNI